MRSPWATPLDRLPWSGDDYDERSEARYDENDDDRETEQRHAERWEGRAE